MLVLFQALVSIESGIKRNSQGIDEIGVVTKHCYYLAESSLFVMDSIGYFIMACQDL